MDPINVLIAFYSRYGRAESLALNVGLGVLQARATPRFRRITDLTPLSLIEADEEWKRNLQRMKIEYIPPRPDDPKLADVVVLVTPDDETVEVSHFTESLATDGSLAGRIAAPIAEKNQEARLNPIYTRLARTGMTIFPLLKLDNPADACRCHGIALVKMARALKAIPAAV